jgi:acetyl-CoA synthetase
MQKDNIFKKTPELFRVPPNLKNYEDACKNWSWDELKKSELEWFSDGKFNAAYNAIDRHLKTFRKNKIALYWEGDENKTEKYTFEEIANQTNKFANYLKSLGVAKGDRVFIFLPRIPYLYIAFLAILKIGAIAGTLFSAFQEQALFDRLENSQAKVLITDSNLGKRVENIKVKLPNLKTILNIEDPSFRENIDKQSRDLEIEHMDPDDFAFMLYTSGTTGKPKGVVHKHIAILSEHISAKYVLDIKDEDTYWCTADPGWVTGIAYEILGSWSCGVTSLIFSGRFDAAKWYELLEKYRISIWYTAPTAVRMLMAKGTDLVKKYNLKSLRHILSVGEPLNPEAIKWGLEAFGN